MCEWLFCGKGAKFFHLGVTAMWKQRKAISYREESKNSAGQKVGARAARDHIAPLISHRNLQEGSSFSIIQMVQTNLIWIWRDRETPAGFHLKNRLTEVWAYLSPPPPRSTPSQFSASYPNEHMAPKPTFPPFVLTLNTQAFASDLEDTGESAPVSKLFLKDAPIRIQRG